MVDNEWRTVTRDHRQVHARWARTISSNRDTSDPSYKAEWYFQQCGGCTHWISLDGELGADWGVCSGEASPFDGRLMFEHDGCDFFEADGDDDARSS